MEPIGIFGTYFLIILTGLLIFVTITSILFQKRSPTSMISWILAVIFLPFLAIPLYFAIGIRKRPKGEAKSYIKYHQSDTHKLYTIHDAKDDTLDILTKNGISPATKDNTFELITSDTQAYERMMHEINNAQSSIDICTYVFQVDEMTNSILEALTKKAHQGVDVRILLDIVGSLGVYFNQKPFQELKDAGGKVDFFVPILKRPFQNYINLRNHRKIYIFDRKVLLSGGMNLSNEYLGPNDGTKRWQDLMYAIKGPAVDDFFSVFYNDWAFATKSSLEPKPMPIIDHQGKHIIQVVPSGPDIQKDALYEALLNAIYSAKELVWIVTPYFVPDDNITQALIIAHHKGVDVKLITPKHSDHILSDIVRSPYMRELNDAGIDVVLYEGEMLHAKAMLVDDKGGMVGSVNMDNRSLFLNYEIVAFIHSYDSISTLKEWMEELMLTSSVGMQKPSRTREGIENIMKVFAPLM